jgi:hypothetical protein
LDELSRERLDHLIFAAEIVAGIGDAGFLGKPRLAPAGITDPGYNVNSTLIAAWSLFDYDESDATQDCD